jgi:hypothetical protein
VTVREPPPRTPRSRPLEPDTRIFPREPTGLADDSPGLERSFSSSTVSGVTRRRSKRSKRICARFSTARRRLTSGCFLNTWILLAFLRSVLKDVSCAICKNVAGRRIDPVMPVARFALRFVEWLYSEIGRLVSLRDICLNVILASQNMVDDVDHCLQAKTSLHLTEIEFGDGNAVILKVEQNSHKQCYCLSFISARQERSKLSITAFCADISQFTTSPIERIPTSSAPSRTGGWRTRFRSLSACTL